MKISNSKKQLAKIIHENGGWHRAANLALFGKVSGRCYMLKTDEWPEYDITIKGFYINARDVVSDFHASPFTNWHQTILSHDEYFHLYPAPDADGWIEWKGGECPVDGGEIIDIRFHDSREEFGTKAEFRRWCHGGDKGDIIAYRLHKPEQSLGASIGREKFASGKIDTGRLAGATTIEQLAADYRNRKNYADLKQQEADAAKADAEVKLAELVAAGTALGLVLSVAGVEPELVITDWRDLLEGDEIEVFNFECPESESRRKQELMSGPCVVMKVEGGNVRIELKKNLPTKGPHWNATGVDACDFKFIRRPSKAAPHA